MSENPLEQYDDIQKIQSFLIIITSPSKPAGNDPNEDNKILPQGLLEELEEKERADEEAPAHSGTAAASLALRKIRYKASLNKKVQRHAEIRERCEQLIHHSPCRARHASTGCLRPPPHNPQKSQLQVSDFHKPTRHDHHHPHDKNQTQKVPFEHRQFVNLPRLKINPFQLVLPCRNSVQKFYLFKTLKYTDKYSLYLAQNEKTRAIYSLKMIKKCAIRREEVARLTREFKIQSFLTHVNLVRLLHITHDQHFLYAFYEPSIATQHSLGEEIKEAGPLFEREVRRIIKQICSAVEYLQRNNIAHQNIRPESVYCQEGIVKLGNFSRAEHVPERLAAKSRSQGNLKESISRSLFSVDKVDIWHIGFLTYELLFGRPLIVLQEGFSQTKIGKDALYFSEEVDVSNMAKEFISACLEVNHAKRLGIREAMEHGFLKGGDKYRWTTA